MHEDGFERLGGNEAEGSEAGRWAEAMAADDVPPFAGERTSNDEVAEASMGVDIEDDKRQLDESLTQAYSHYAEVLLTGADQLTTDEQSELPDDWQHKLAAIADSSGQTDGFTLRKMYRESIQTPWEETSLQNAVLRDPSLRGVGEIKVIDGRNNLTVEELYGSLSDEQRQMYSVDYIEQRLANEAATHRAELTHFLGLFGGQLKQGRVCPAPEYSPFALINAEQADGSIRIDPEFVKDIQQMREAGMTDINLVASFATRNGDGTTNMDLPEVERYCGMIEALVEQTGPDGLTISIGNETNATMTSNPDGLDDLKDLAVSKEIPPEEYAKFYREVATRLKGRFPELKLCPAGTTFLAPNYMKRVLENIYAQPTDVKLVDRIDFHPYRTDVEEPAAAGTEAKYGEVEHKQGWTYDNYENELLKLAEEYGAELIMGEVQFGGGDAPGATVMAHRKLEQSLQSSTTKGIRCNIWPRVGLPF